MVGGSLTPAAKRGTLSTRDLRGDFLAHLARYREGISDVKAVIDCSDGMASVLIHDVISGLPAELITMYDTPDGTFPHRPPNPLDEAKYFNMSDYSNSFCCIIACVVICACL